MHCARTMSFADVGRHLSFWMTYMSACSGRFRRRCQVLQSPLILERPGIIVRRAAETHQFR
eukprot:5027461-Prorocentrum_lima.AAC.1